MNTNNPIHTFHIPVMGLAYTIDSPIRVAQYGISSVISIIDDEVIERCMPITAKNSTYITKEFQIKFMIIVPKESRLT